MEFGYWGLKGAGEPTRWIGAYLGIQWTEYNPASREEWFGSKKAEVGGAFPNLPYLKDGDFVLTESSAIPVYLAHKANRTDLLGNDAKEQAIVRQIEGVLGDIRQAVMKVLFAPGDKKEELKKALGEGGVVHTKAGLLSKFLGTKEFFLGHVTLADFAYAYLCELVCALSASFDLECSLCSSENLCGLCKRVTSLQGIKELHEKRLEVPFMPPQMLDFHFKTSAEAKKCC